MGVKPAGQVQRKPILATHAKWYQQSLYLLWKQGVSLVLIYQVQDEPHYGPPGRFPGSSYDTGAYFANGKAKPAARAIRFPFVADRQSKPKVQIWGIAPKSGKLSVTQKGKGPKNVARIQGEVGQGVHQERQVEGQGKALSQRESRRREEPQVPVEVVRRGQVSRFQRPSSTNRADRYPTAQK